MFYILSKILRFMISPCFWLVILMLFALIFTKKRKLILITSLLFFIFITNGFVVTKLISYYETPLTPISKLENYDIGIVLGGAARIVVADTHRLFLGPSGDRITQAIQLYKLGKIKKILFSGGNGNLSGNKTPESILVRKYLLQIGIPENDLLFEENSKNTYENALFTKEILEKNKLENMNFLLITSSLHMPRSMAIFKKLDYKVTPFSIDQLYDPTYRDFDFYYVPKTENIQNVENILHEIIGYITYKLMGYC